MADAKPEAKKTDGGGKPAPSPAPAPDKKDPFIEIVSILLGFFLLLYVFNNIAASITQSKIFAQGWSGINPQQILKNHTRPISSLFNPIGVRIVSLHNLDVLGRPSGNKIGTQDFNARGKITQGPISIGDKTYYYVDFDSGQDGWVEEGDIGYMDSEPTLFELLIIYIFTVIRVVKVVAVILSILIIFFLVYVVRRLTELRVNERKLLYPNRPMVPDAPPVNIKWERIESHIESLNENDWRLAILEADIILSDLLDKLSLPGDTIGERLKAVEKSDFTTINSAWEAHKIRNQVAHEGSEFKLSQREAKRVIQLYRDVFEEFEIV